MSITDKTRKMLWARSGNRCALCRIELAPKEASNDGVIVGEECHIVSQRPLGPRYVDNFSNNHDGYENLLLLCANDHKRVDTLVETYPSETLLLIKKQHEDWVKTTLEIDSFAFTNDSLQIVSLARLRSGKTLFNIVDGAHAFQFDYPELENGEHVDLVASLFQQFQDYGDLDLEIGEKIRVSADMTRAIAELEVIGIWLYGGTRDLKLKLGGQMTNWKMATVVAALPDNPGVVGEFLIIGTPREVSLI